MNGESGQCVGEPAAHGNGGAGTAVRGVLVVWHSLGGRTAQVGEELARLLQADREPIRAPVHRERPGGRWCARWEALLKRSAPILPMHVSDDCRGSGLAGLLMSALIGNARARGLWRMEGDVLASNRDMLRFAHRLGFRRQAADGGVVRDVLELQPPQRR